MYGIRLATVAPILARAVFLNSIFGKNGAIKGICLQIQKACLENDIAMVKALLKTIASQDIEAFAEMEKVMRETLSDEEWRELVK